MFFLELLFVFSLLGIPLLLHLLLNFVLEVFKFFFSVLGYNFLAILVLILDCLLLLFDLFLLAFIFLEKVVFLLLFGRLLLLLEPFSLLTHRVSDRLLDLPFPVPNSLLAFTPGLLLGIFKFVVVLTLPGPFPLPVAL